MPAHNLRSRALAVLVLVVRLFSRVGTFINTVTQAAGQRRLSRQDSGLIPIGGLILPQGRPHRISPIIQDNFLTERQRKAGNRQAR